MPPSEETKAALAGLFTRAAATYGEVGPGYFGQGLIARMRLAPGMHVLDVACGRGAALFPAADAVGSAGWVTGIDLSDGIVTATNGEIAQRGVHNASAQVMDAEQLAFPDGAFDAVSCALALFFMPHRAAALAEFHSVLRADGRVGISTLEPQSLAAEAAR